MRAWLLARDPGLEVVRRAVRVAVATCVVFLPANYLLDQPTVALYGAFGCIALGGLSDVAGSANRRAATLVAAGAAGAVLISIGTYLSVSVVTATAGMVVVGFAVSFAGILGPRAAGVANGLQLFYILPSFPPYDPAALGPRLAGLLAGLVVLVVVDRYLVPAAVPSPHRERVAAAVGSIADQVAALRPSFSGEEVPDAVLAAAGARTRSLVDEARLSAQPPLLRPSGPGRRDRASAAAAVLTRFLAARVEAFGSAVQAAAAGRRGHRGEQLLDAVEQCLRQCQEALRGGPLPDVVALDAALRRAASERARWLVSTVRERRSVDARVAVGATLSEVASSTRVLALAVTLTRGGQLPDGVVTPADQELFWFAGRSLPALLAVRVRGQLRLQSVWFRNAIRVAVALGAARLLAEVLDLSHAFWVLLATLTLMRTTYSATRAAVVPALVGTLMGALLAVPLLVFVGGDSPVLAALLPVLLVGTFAAAPLFGQVFGQAGLTLAVAALFAQVSPASWSLAAWRVLDILVGALIGVGAGLLAWPRGASGQLVDVCREALLRCADALRASAQGVVDGVEEVEGQDEVRAARRAQLHASETVAFAMAEPDAGRRGVPWREVLDACRQMVEGGQYLQHRRRGDGVLPWPEARELLLGLAREDHDEAVRLAHSVPQLSPDRWPGTVRPAPTIADWLERAVSGDVPPPGVLDVIDARTWLIAVRRDLDHLAPATDGAGVHAGAADAA